MTIPRRRMLIGMLAASGSAAMATGPRTALAQAQPWQTLPPTPRWPQPHRSGLVLANGARLFYAQFGHGPHVLLLHGGMGNSNHWGHLIGALAPRYTVTALDTRGHGRSPLVPGAFSYRLLADDFAAALAALGIPSAAIVGWSDGAIAALQMAIAHPAKVTRAFAFGGNIALAGYKAGGSRSPVFAAYSRRCQAEYQQLSPNPAKWPDLLRALAPMWRTEPGIGRAQLAALKLPVAIAAGQHDEIIRREHTETMAKSIPGARLEILPEVSHFAMLQQPAAFNRAVLAFLSA